MKKNYIIQDAEMLFSVIAFDSKKSLNNYLSNFGFQFKMNRTCIGNNTCVYGVLNDRLTDNGYTNREVYIREIETSRY